MAPQLNEGLSRLPIAHAKAGSPASASVTVEGSGMGYTSIHPSLKYISDPKEGFVP